MRNRYMHDTLLKSIGYMSIYLTIPPNNKLHGYKPEAIKKHVINHEKGLLFVSTNFN